MSIPAEQVTDLAACMKPRGQTTDLGNMHETKGQTSDMVAWIARIESDIRPGNMHNK